MRQAFEQPLFVRGLLRKRSFGLRRLGGQAQQVGVEQLPELEIGVGIDQLFRLLDSMAVLRRAKQKLDAAQMVLGAREGRGLAGLCLIEVKAQAPHIGQHRGLRAAVRGAKPDRQEQCRQPPQHGQVTPAQAGHGKHKPRPLQGVYSRTIFHAPSCLLSSSTLAETLRKPSAS